MAEEYELRVFSSHAEARAADLEERAKMTMAERMRLGAELHAFWARNYYPDAKGLERTLQVLERPGR